MPQWHRPFSIEEAAETLTNSVRDGAADHGVRYFIASWVVGSAFDPRAEVGDDVLSVRHVVNGFNNLLNQLLIGFLVIFQTNPLDVFQN